VSTSSIPQAVEDNTSGRPSVRTEAAPGVTVEVVTTLRLSGVTAWSRCVRHRHSVLLVAGSGDVTLTATQARDLALLLDEAATLAEAGMLQATT
jgi:hypothetical protein